MDNLEQEREGGKGKEGKKERERRRKRERMKGNRSREVKVGLWVFEDSHVRSSSHSCWHVKTNPFLLNAVSNALSISMSPSQ